MNCFSFAHSLFWVCSNSGMSRSFLTSTLSCVSLRQPVGEKCFYFATEKFQLSRQDDKKLHPAHESRRKEGPTNWCRWMATFLRRVNASDFPSSGARCAGLSSARHRLQKDTMLFEIGKTRFSSNVKFFFLLRQDLLFDSRARNRIFFFFLSFLFILFRIQV